LHKHSLWVSSQLSSIEEILNETNWSSIALESRILKGGQDSEVEHRAVGGPR
jgi:hypothetical protein